MSNNVVVMQETDQPMMRVYNVRFELTAEAHEDGCRNGADKLGLFGQLLVSIPGIEVVRVQPYRFFISKAVMFEWSEIEPRVAELVESLNSVERLIAGAHGRDSEVADGSRE